MNLRFVMEDWLKKKGKKKYLLNLIEKCISMIMARKLWLAYYLSTIRRKGRTKSKGSLLEESPRGWEKKKKRCRENHGALDNRANILCLPFCNLAGCEARVDGLSSPEAGLKFYRRFAFEKKKKKLSPSSPRFVLSPVTIRKKKASVNPSWKIHRETNANICIIVVKSIYPVDEIMDR